MTGTARHRARDSARHDAPPWRDEGGTTTMRIHSDIITSDDIHAARQAATLSGPAPLLATTLAEYGSRHRRQAFEVLLSGNNSRRQMGGQHKAATYDEWGHFLARLFAVDPRMVCRAYNGANDFHYKTKSAYRITVSRG